MTNAPQAQVRILVVRAPHAPRAPHLQQAARALACLGPEASIEEVEAEACVDRALDPPADLVVLDAALGTRARDLLDGMGRDGPPVVVLTSDGADALDLFQRGAADCIAVGPDLDDVLPVVALEQIRRFRTQRERGRRERRIRWLERLHDAIIGQLPAALVVLDPAGRIVTVNPEFGRLFGPSLSLARGRSYDRVLPADLVESAGIATLLADLESGLEPVPRLGRTHVHAPPGRARVLDVRAQQLDDDGRVLLVLVDVSERERLQRRMRDLRGYTENVVENMNGALLAVDVTGAVTYANGTAEELLGAPADVLRGTSIWDRLGTRGPTGGRGPAGEGAEPAAPDPLAATLREGRRFRGVATSIAASDGRRVPASMSCAPLVDAGGRRVGAVAILQDLTEIQQLQRQVLQSEKLASIGQLAAGVAHEINNPMGFIHANLFQMAEYVGDLRRVWQHVGDLHKAVLAGDAAAARRAADELSEAAREVDADFVLSDLAKAVRESQEGSERIRHIVQDLRGFSRQDTAERVPSDLNQCLDSTANIVWTMMKHSVRLEKDYAELPEVSCYPMQLKQVFMNLLVNAYQAIEEQIAGRDETGIIALRTRRMGDEVRISVRDSGCGIPADRQGRIFDPFFTTKAVGEGMGLGLSTSYGIVRRHGGTMRVESRVGEGTTFEVVLPVDGDEAARPPEAG